MDPIILISLAIGLSLAMMLAWVAQLLTHKSGWIDTIWTFAVGFGGIAAALLPDAAANANRRIAVAVLVAIWAGRLGLHIAGRTHGGGDDPRYAALQQQQGKAWPVYLFFMLQVQALAAFVLVFAVRLAAVNPAAFPHATDYAGIALLLIAFAGEAIADAQLAKFGKAHKGRSAVCDIGLWQWSRHPNYFFEWLGWCAWAVLAIGPSPWVWTAVIAPAWMYILLVHISGIPPLEKHMLATRPTAFKAYQARVNAFFPGPQNKEPRS